MSGQEAEADFGECLGVVGGRGFGVEADEWLGAGEAQEEP